MKSFMLFKQVVSRALLIIISLVLVSPSLASPKYKGVNLAGADFGYDIRPGDFGTQYTYPTHEEIDYFTDKGMNVFRLPFLWERLQNDQNGPLNTEELARIKDFVSYASSKQAKTILDPHNSARYYDEIIGIDGPLGALPKAAFKDFWRKLANEFKSNQGVIFGLMNEPHDMSSELWRDDANAGIAAIRATGAKNLILVPGNAWSGAHSWNDDSYGTPNSTVMKEIIDPANNYAFEVHQYMDSDSSGGSDKCMSTSIGSERLVDFTQWLKENNAKGFLGEFAGGRNQTCLTAIDDMLQYMEKNDSVWLGWTYWAAGPWWGDDIFTLEPKDGNDRPQMIILEKYLSVTKTDSSTPDTDTDNVENDDSDKSESSSGGNFSTGLMTLLLGLLCFRLLFKKPKAALLFGLFLGLNGVVNAQQYHVAKLGNDANSGSEGQPFASISKCANVAVAGDTCLVASGIYRETITPAHSGTSSAPITFKAKPGNHVLISGADIITGFSSAAEGRYRANINWDLGRGNNQVFADGKMLWEARFPNANSDLMSSLSGKIEGPSKKNSVWYFSHSQLPGGLEGAYINILPGPEWVAETGVVTGSSPSNIGFKALYGQLKDSYYNLREGNPYMIWGHLSLLDDTNEFYHDGDTLQVKLNPAEHLIEAKRRYYAFVLDKRSHIIIDGFDVFAATITTGQPDPAESELGSYPNTATSSHIVLNNLNLRYVSHYTFIRPGTKNSGPGVFEAWSKGMTNSGVMLFGTNHTIKNSTIAYSAGNGISLAGRNHLVDNVIVHDVDYSVTDGAALLAGFYDIESSGHTVRNSSFSRSARSILTHRGVQNLKVLNNDLFDAGLVAHDLGITYTYQTDGAGTVIAGNKVHGNARSGDFIGIYLDNGSSGITVHHNIVWDVSHAFQINMPPPHSAINNTVVNNTFIGNETSVRSWGPNKDNFNQNFQEMTLKNNILVTRRSAYTSSVAVPPPLFNEANNIEMKNGADVQFIDFVHHDFRPSPESSAIDGGQIISGITGEFSGAAPDIGAIEAQVAFNAGASFSKPCVYGDDCAPRYENNSMDETAGSNNDSNQDSDDNESSVATIYNPSFESPYVALGECELVTGNIAEDWNDNTCWDTQANILYSEDLNNPHAGESSQKIKSQGSLVQLVQAINFDTSKTYTASVWMRAETALSVTLLLRQTGAPYDIYAEKQVSLTNQWQRFSLTARVNDSDSFFMLLTEDKGVLWVDDAKITTAKTAKNENNTQNDQTKSENTKGGTLAYWVILLLISTRLTRRK